jgi:hypothetical protein
MTTVLDDFKLGLECDFSDVYRECVIVVLCMLEVSGSTVMCCGCLQLLVDEFCVGVVLTVYGVDYRYYCRCSHIVLARALADEVGTVAVVHRGVQCWWKSVGGGVGKLWTGTFVTNIPILKEDVTIPMVNSLSNLQRS